ncbi:MAG TPA: FHA domain-containing protein [Nitrospira sp.]|nr:FHA domain-containing protein [Nitrospira sp.]
MDTIVTAPAKLLVKLQGQGSRTIDILRDTFTIGRKADNDLPIDDHTVSSRHVKIVRVQSVYFVEDLKSTNGTAVNGKPIDRAQLHDADVITIGQHRIIFQDSAPAPAAPASASLTDMEKTMAISSKDLRAGTPSTTAKLLVTAGKTDRLEYHLTKPANLIGSQEGAAIQLTGWFAPKTAALISSRGGTYSISPSQGSKKLSVNGKDVSGQQPLKDGDVIEVAGVSMTFYVVTQKNK